MGKKTNYDFAGWVTKNDVKCLDGAIIRHGAFKDNDGAVVPLVWNHDYNSPSNVLGSVHLSNQKEGVYGFGYFNDSEEASHARELLKHRDISSMSIGARKIKRQGTDVVHGSIYEVSLVLTGANPEAVIETVMEHSADGTTSEKAIIFPGFLIHSADDILQNNEDESNDSEGETETMADKTVKEVLETLNEEQAAAVQMLLEAMAEGADDEGDEDEDEEEIEQGMSNEGDDVLKHNVFNNSNAAEAGDVIKHSISEVLTDAMRSSSSSFRQMLENKYAADDVIMHGINSIDMLFPEAAHSTNGNTPILYRDPNTSYSEILSGTSKSPFSKIRTLVADLTEEEARAKGYIKGNFKKEEFFSLIKRQTGPTTVYKKQKLDRDDMLDITDFDVVTFMAREMKGKLEEEIARAVLVGDGRDVASDDKINEQCIRPIISDHEFFTIQKSYTTPLDFVEQVIRGMAEYRGSGSPTMYIDPSILMDIKLMKGTDGKYLFGDIPSTTAIAARMGVTKIVETTFMTGKGAIIVNLRDYTVGAVNGGQIANFNDFDIDFNQYKYLIETRLCGALTMPKSAIHIAATVGTGASTSAAGMVYGQRQADKPVTPPEGQ